MTEFQALKGLFFLCCLLAIAKCAYQPDFNYKVPEIPKHLQEIAEDMEWAAEKLDEYKNVINILFIEDEEKKYIEMSYILWKLYTDCPQLSCIVCWNDSDPDCEQKNGFIDAAVYISLRIRSWCKTVMEEIEVGLMDVESFYLKKAFEVENYIINHTSFSEFNNSRVCIRKLISSYLLPNYQRPILVECDQYEKYIRQAIELDSDHYDAISNKTAALELIVILFVVLLLVALWLTKLEYQVYKKNYNKARLAIGGNAVVGVDMANLG
ncbi:unnamed protein product [Moneuplotes crassus]|uniref:Uncharacterized protein n=1 Tax=Euplotes crassus TaxID=5936 RepID=A0AAD1XQS3_EUPCR|nr:unnamed protein product [Moneuplotes crassus]